MLSVGVIGIGNTGNQVAALANERLKIPAIAINSSEKDLETISQNIPKKIIKDKSGFSTGAGKDRSLAKKYLKDSIRDIIQDEEITEMVTPLDVVFVISSTGGGTGSGTAPIMANILSETFKDTKCILIGVLPVNSEGYLSHVNTLEYLEELSTLLVNQTYMLYDNNKLADKNTPSYKILDKVNSDIVSDIDVLRCTYNYPTKYDSIDDKDMMRLISEPGLMTVASIEGFQDKDCDNQTIEDMLINELKVNTHVEIQRDNKIVYTGIIVNLSENLFREFNDNIPAVREFLGEPDADFKHDKVYEERRMPNNAFLIATGLSFIKDRKDRTKDRIDEIDARQRAREADRDQDDIDLAELKSRFNKGDAEDNKDSVDMGSIFDKFNA